MRFPFLILLGALLLAGCDSDPDPSEKYKVVSVSTADFKCGGPRSTCAVTPACAPKDDEHVYTKERVTEYALQRADKSTKCMHNLWTRVHIT